MLPVDEKSDLIVVPVKEQVDLVPSIGCVFNVDELLSIYLKSLVVSESVEYWSCQSALLTITLLKRQFILANVLFLK